MRDVVDGLLEELGFHKLRANSMTLSQFQMYVCASLRAV